jgi:Right handed beta helix region
MKDSLWGGDQMDTARVRNLGALVVTLALVTTWVARVEAYPSYDDGAGVGCVSCHIGFKNTGPLHLDHLTKFGITSCTLCHTNVGGEKPVLTYFSADGYGCSGCHGRDYGETSINSGQPKSTSYGLRLKHLNHVPSVTECGGCHFPGSGVTGEPNPAPAILPETVPPPYYGRVTNNLTDPCSTAQESFDATIGLDNDGNGFADKPADSACAAFIPTTTTTVSTSTTTSSTTTTTLPTGAKRITVYPGQSIQEAVDAIAPGGTIYVMPGTYQETHGGQNAVTISKNGVRLIGRTKRRQGLKVILQAGPGQQNGIVVQPAVANTRIDGFRLKGFTVQGFPNNGILTRYLDNFRIERNESIDNLENGIWPTLSANGLVKKNVSYGSEDSALWIEASEDIRVIGNELHHSPTGLEVTISHNISVRKNDVHDNTTGIGLYHPSAAGLPPLVPFERNGYWDVVGNHVYNNNEPNSAPPGTMSAGLPPGGGILVLGVDHVNVQRNKIENNDFYGISVVDYCLAVAGTNNDCGLHPPTVTDTQPQYNTFVSNRLTGNGTDPVPFGGFELFAADVTYLVLGTGPNCFANNRYGTFQAPFPAFQPTLANHCRY